VTYLCVPIFVTDLAKAKADIARAAEAGADLVELRIDTLTDPTQVSELLSASVLPTIVTCRPDWEGGASTLDDAARFRLLDQEIDDAATYIDLELRAVQRTGGWPSREKRAGLIVSAHDFSGRPEKLYNLITELNAAPGDVNKIVWMPRTIRENLEAFELLQQRQKPTIALCMGEAGLISRVLAKKFGAFLTFASLDDSSATAPGQVSITDLKRLYRWDAITPETRIYGVVGSPIAHSMSPAIHNAAFEQAGHDGVYLPLLVEPGYESFKAFMETFLHFPGLHLSGLSITIPHKENALRYLQEKGADLDPLAQRIGALNTIVIDGTSEIANRKSQIANPFTLRGFSTDYPAILDSITSALNITREQLAEYRVAVIGAGGTGRTAVAALAHYGATVVVYNRTKERADALAGEFNGKTGRVVSARIDKLCDSCCHIYINTTSVGMHPNTDVTPFGDQRPAFSSDTLVFDTIYNPIKTRLLAEAEAAGAKTISGVEMFIRQAAGQFEAWTHKPAPIDLMRRVIEARLLR
jgi:3-dehydroquinate dehydratase/shikimate dehydrogenase